MSRLAGPWLCPVAGPRPHLSGSWVTRQVAKRLFKALARSLLPLALTLLSKLRLPFLGGVASNKQLLLMIMGAMERANNGGYMRVAEFLRWVPRRSVCAE